MLWILSFKRILCCLFLIFIVFLYAIIIINGRFKINIEKESTVVTNKSQYRCEYYIESYDELSKPKLKINSKYKQNFGKMGKPVILSENLSIVITDEMLLHDEKIFGYRRHISDLIPLRRRLPDNRDKDCREAYANEGSMSLMKDDFLEDDFPMTSIIIIFHNEARSTLLRTIYSVLSRTPRLFMMEILLIDDYSTMEELKYPLELFLEKQKLNKVVRLLRTHMRLGINEARRFAARHAVSNVLTFLDPCCECTIRWLQPLIQRISISPFKVAVPVVDRIDPINFEYQRRDSNNIYTGGFDWNLRRTSDRASIKNNINPIKNPVILNGIFAIHRSLFETLDISDDYFAPHDPDLVDLELSFKIWMCGGEIELIPCSHVGCVSRIKLSTSSNFSTENESIKIQKARIAEIWMDEFKEYYYQRMGSGVVKIGFVQEIKSIKVEMECEPFEWYLNYVYPSIENIEYYLSGELLHLRKDNRSLCVDSQNDSSGPFKSIKLSKCHGKGGNQFWILSKDGKITQDGACLGYEDDLVILTKCNDISGQIFWSYNSKTKRILHISSNKCLTVSRRAIINLKDCTLPYRQLWEFRKYNNKVIF